MPEYGPSVPVSRFCNSLKTWAQAIKDEERGQAVAEAGGFLVAFGGERDKRLSAVPDIIDQLQLPMMKSNLLYRLIYLGEPLRTEKCPKHQGRWSGCSWSNPPCDCQKVIVDGKVGYDSNVTGWLLDGNPEVTAACGSRTWAGKDGERLPTGYVRSCTLISGHAGECEWTEPYKPPAMIDK